MKHEIILRFCVWDFEDISHEEITKAIGINPTKTYFKGQKKNPKFLALSKINGWIMQSKLSPHFSFEEQMEEMIDIIELKMDVFKNICNKYTCELSCALQLRFNNGESIPSIHLNSRYNKIIREGLNIDFDLDIYCQEDE